MVLRLTLLRILPELALLTIVAVNAATITVSNNTFQGEFGSYHNSIGTLELRDAGTTVASVPQSASGASCSTAVFILTIGGAGNTTVTAGHLVYAVKVVAKTGISGNKCFQVSLSYNGGSLINLYANTTLVPLAGDFATLSYDLGISSLASIYTIHTTAQQV